MIIRTPKRWEAKCEARCPRGRDRFLPTCHPEARRRRGTSPLPMNHAAERESAIFGCDVLVARAARDDTHSSNAQGHGVAPQKFGSAHSAFSFELHFV